MRVLFTILCCITLLIMIVRLDVRQGKVISTMSQDVVKPDFHFEIIEEQISGDEYPMSNARILINSKDYSKDNLERIFRWYAATHVRKGELLKVLVYTSRDNLFADKKLEEIVLLKKLNPHFTPKDPINIRRNGALYDAFFHRDEESNELYYYLPNLDQPDITATVVIKGRDRFKTDR